MMVTNPQNNDYSGPKTIRFTLNLHTIKQTTSAYWTNTLWIKLWYTLHRRWFCFRTSIYWIHGLDQHKTVTLFLKFKILNFETLSHVHVYCIENVFYQQGPYRIRIDTAADRIVPYFDLWSKSTVIRQVSSMLKWMLRKLTYRLYCSFQKAHLLDRERLLAQIW